MSALWWNISVALSGLFVSLGVGFTFRLKMEALALNFCSAGRSVLPPPSRQEQRPCK
jgi:hypothetical protein